MTPYHRELLSDVNDWKLFEAGMAALERISGISEKVALDALVEVATPEQRQRFTARMTRLEEFNALPAELRDKLNQEDQS